MAKGDKFLWQRGRQWYFRLAIPRGMRHLFPPSETGRAPDKLAEPLGSSYEVAKVKAAARAATCMAIFDGIRARVITTPEQVKAALRPRSAYQIELEERNEAVARFAADFGEVERRLAEERSIAWYEIFGRSGDPPEAGQTVQPAPTATGWTITQAAEAWYAELTSDKAAAPRDTTLNGYRLHVRAFVDAVGDLPVTEVTAIMASDFLAALKMSNGTRNTYATTLKCVFECARRRGRLTGDNPFDGMKGKVVHSSYQPFTVDELQTLFNDLPREIRPKKHSPDTALPWAALIALYSGMRLEEIAQLTTADVREETANGASVWCIDIHNGGTNKLKNKPSARLIPVHSELVRLGLLDYVKALPKGPLFPGLVRRESKGGKVGARVGELFRKKLVALKLKRDGLCFHSLRHNVSNSLDVAGVPQSDTARVLGHLVVGMSYGTYSKAGPGLKRVAAVVEMITYEGLRL
jgi:integrase